MNTHETAGLTSAADQACFCAHHHLPREGQGRSLGEPGQPPAQDLLLGTPTSLPLQKPPPRQAHLGPRSWEPTVIPQLGGELAWPDDVPEPITNGSRGSQSKETNQLGLRATDKGKETQSHRNQDGTRDPGSCHFQRFEGFLFLASFFRYQLFSTQYLPETMNSMSSSKKATG